MFKNTEEITEYFVKNGWAADTFFEEVTLTEAQDKGLLSVINGINKGQKFFKMSNGNIYNNAGECILFNMLTACTYNKRKKDCILYDNAQHLGNDLKYWSNSCGDLHYHGEYNIAEEQLPSELKRAYNVLWKEGQGCYEYLVEFKGTYYIALISELNKDYADDCNMSMDELYSQGLHNAKEMYNTELFKNTLLVVGKGTGFEKCHEFIFLVPFWETEQTYNAIENAIYNKIYYVPAKKDAIDGNYVNMVTLNDNGEQVEYEWENYTAFIAALHNASSDPNNVPARNDSVFTFDYRDAAEEFHWNEYDLQNRGIKTVRDLMETRILDVTVLCQAVYNSSIKVPAVLTETEAIDYARKHIDEIQVHNLEWISDTELDSENCNFEGVNS